MNASVPLRPCPFCGSPAEMSVGGFGEHSARCTNGQCVLQAGIWFTSGEADKAVELWNRRAPSSVVAEVVREMREFTNRVPDEGFDAVQLLDSVIAWTDRLERGE